MRNDLVSEHEGFLDDLQRAAFDYFLKNTNPKNGLIADTSRQGSPCSIAVVGLGLTAYTVGIARGWLARTDAVARTLATLKFFWNSPSGDQTGVTGYKGFYYHFLDMQTGLRVWDCELSMIDTALLMSGILSVGAYFSAANQEEQAIRDLAEKIYGRVDWDWARNGGVTLSQGWKPDCGFLHYGWEGYNEGTILYILGLASPTYPLDIKSYQGWGLTYQWENMYGHDFLYAGPLFIHQFSHIWVDFRGIQDDFMREKNCDYFENSRRAVYIQQNYGRLNPLRFSGYNEFCWGLSAGEGPSGRTVHVRGRNRECAGYTARGVPYGPDDGTLAPSAVAASIPFAPELAIPVLKHIQENYSHVIQDGRIPTGFNPSVLEEDGRAWVSDGYFGLDQGATLLMIENFRTGFVWNLVRKNTYLKRGLELAGFKGGWLS